jgi:hypothetical protein
MQLKYLYRLFLLIPFLAVAAGFSVGHYPGEISADWKTVLEWHGDGDLLYNISIPESLWGRALMIAICIAILVALIVSTVGMFLFWRFARSWYLVLTVVLLLSLPFSGLTVYLPLQEFFNQIALMFEGAAIAMAYFSPIKSHFEGGGMSNIALDSGVPSERRST